uniref:Uncharacterized protein n=1 Tax=Romanomermis culicivorax TaxID=13658 RepID=A0A915IP71_ROMCU
MDRKSTSTYVGIRHTMVWGNMIAFVQMFDNQAGTTKIYGMQESGAQTWEKHALVETGDRFFAINGQLTLSTSKSKLTMSQPSTNCDLGKHWPGALLFDGNTDRVCRIIQSGVPAFDKNSNNWCWLPRCCWGRHCWDIWPDN